MTRREKCPENAVKRHSASPIITEPAGANASTGDGAEFSEPNIPKNNMINDMTAASAKTEPISVSHTAFRRAKRKVWQ